MYSASLIALIVGFLLHTFTFHLEPNIKEPDGEIRDVSDIDFKPRDLPSKYYSELWTYHFILNQDIHIVYTISLSDLGGFKERVGGAKLLVYWKNGRTYTINKEYPYEDFYYDEDINELGLNRSRPYWMRGSLDSTIDVSFKTGKDGINYDLRVQLSNIVKGKRRGDGEYRINGNQLGLSLLVAHSDVKGTAAIDGDTLSVEGFAYMDHQYQTFNSTKFISKGFRFKKGDHQNGMVGHLEFLKKNSSTPVLGYLLTIENGASTYQEISEINWEGNIEIGGKSVGNTYALDTNSGKSLSFSLDQVLMKYSMLSELGKFARALVRNLFGAEVMEFIATGQNSANPVVFNGFVIK